MKVVKFKIVGEPESPLLMNNPAGGMRQSDSGEGVKVNKTVIPTPEEEARRSAYIAENGQLWGPAIGFRSALLTAGVGRKIGKEPAWKALARTVFMVDEKCLLTHPKTGKPIKEWSIDTRRCVLSNRGKKVGILRNRAKVDHWQTVLSLSIDTEVIDPSVVLELLNLAGRNIGWLDFRVQNKGWFGKFRAELME